MSPSYGTTLRSRISVLSHWIFGLRILVLYVQYDVLCTNAKAREANQVYGAVLFFSPLSYLEVASPGIYELVSATNSLRD
jgi:hypothetical protein